MRAVGRDVEGDVLDDVVSAEGNRQGRRGRHVMVAMMALLVLAGVTGLLGEHTSTVSGSGEGYRLSVTYGRVSRAGLDTPWIVTVHHDAGLPEEVTLETTRNYFDIFETQGFTPEPSEETTTADVLRQTFTAPEGGDTMTIAYDAYIQPASQIGRRGRTALVVDGRTVAAVDYRTWLVP